MLLITQRIAGGGVLKADARSDIAGIYAVDILTVVSVHLQNTAQTLALILVAFSTEEPAVMVPEYTRKNVRRPTNGR